MKKNLLLVTLLISFSTLTAQSFSWAANMGGTSLDNGLSVAVDASGNVYTVGYFQGTADFDPRPKKESRVGKITGIYL